MIVEPLCAELLAFVEASPTPFHAVASSSRMLAGAGFSQLDMRASWADLAPGGYFVERDGALLAFILPESEVAGFRIVGAHTDSPNLRLKPHAMYAKDGYLQLGVEVYGGALVNSWLDRDLSIAGRAIVRSPDGSRAAHLVRLSAPIARVAQLAIHLDREVNERGVALNRQEHLPPIIGLTLSSTPNISTRALCAAVLGIDADSIIQTDLMLYDVAPPTIGGVHGEFIFSARLDNLAMCHAAVRAIMHAASEQVGDSVPLIALFDHEEIGSASSRGAASSLLPTVIERIVQTRCVAREAYHRAVANSVCISADMAHAVHPNYADRHDARHRPTLNGGPVIKLNSQQRYATSADSAAMFEELCRAEQVPVQYYAHRTDLPCGSTIGPITSTQLGIPTVDVGCAMLSMHSIREMSGAHDQTRMVQVLGRFLSTL